MDWNSLGKTLANVGLPILGTAIGGPAGGLVGKMVAGALGLAPGADAQTIANAISTNPDNVVKLQELQLQHQEFLTKAAYDAEIAEAGLAKDQVEAVNKTLQTEAMGGSWLQRNHHAIESIFVVGLVGAIYFILPLLKLPVPSVPSEAWLMLGAILGVTAWQRGKANVVAAGASNA